MCFAAPQPIPGCRIVSTGRVLRSFPAAPTQGWDVNTRAMVGAAGLAACVALFMPLSSFSLPSAAASSTARVAKTASAPPTRAKPVRVKDPETTSSVTPAADDKCLRSRKRLWVEGEGWVVRRVATCF
jgi:hypothetical protein